jgi:uncharacterized protein (TIGR01244 family)
MPDFRKVTETFSVAPQITVADLDAAAQQGFTLVINNRPDGEAPDQPPSARMAAAAEAAGLDYVHIPVLGGPTQDQVAAVRAAIAGAKGPVLAFCRSGTRSIVTWSLGQAEAGADRADLIGRGREAGYDLSGVLG